MPREGAPQRRVVVTGPIKTGRGPLIGDAGEHFVVAELLRRGWLAALAPRNSTAFDVLATRGERMIKLRVKTKTGAAREVARDSGGWVWNQKPDGVVFRDMSDKDDLVVMVSLPNDGPVRYWIAPTRTVDVLLRERHAAWLARPGKHGRPHRDGAMRRLPESAAPEAWREAWAAL